MTGDGGDTCFLKLSLTRAGRKNFPERPPARLRERDFRKSLSPVSPCHPEVSHLGIVNKSLKFRMWFKNGLKAQKLLAQGIALGIMAVNKAPCKGKSFVNC